MVAAGAAIGPRHRKRRAAGRVAAKRHTMCTLRIRSLGDLDGPHGLSRK
jgi:hypothetical protein